MVKKAIYVIFMIMIVVFFCIIAFLKFHSEEMYKKNLSCGFIIDSYCFSKPFIPTPLTKIECEAEKNILGIKNCYYEKDYWAGAVKACNGVKNMPSKAILNKLAKKMYNTKILLYNDNNLFLDKKVANFYGFEINGGFLVWSNEEYSQIYTYYYGFYPKNVNWSSFFRNYNIPQAVCIINY